MRNVEYLGTGLGVFWRFERVEAVLELNPSLVSRSIFVLRHLGNREHQFREFNTVFFILTIK